MSSFLPNVIVAETLKKLNVPGRVASATAPAHSITFMSAPLPTTEQVNVALGGVQDPEIHKPITELGMVKSVSIAADGVVEVGVYLTVSGCPMRDTITSRRRAHTQEADRK